MFLCPLFSSYRQWRETVWGGDTVGFLFEEHLSLCKTTYGNAFSSVPLLHILHTQTVEFDGMCT